MTETVRDHDVVVAGGGPAGATTAALLARAGWNVLVLEKERFPRYSVGESLMPYCYFTLERLGLIEQLKRSAFPRKYSVQFVSTGGRVSQPFYFFQHLDHEASTTWQVLRSEFDQLLLDNARAKGAAVREEVSVTRLIREAGSVTGVEAVTRAGERFRVRAPMTVDATGRAAVSAASNRWRIRDRALNRAALWTYYRGALRDPGLDEGATTIAYLPEKGWFWYIPLPEDRVSVGVVAHKSYLFRESRDLQAVFDREIQRNPWIREHVAPGCQEVPVRLTGDYSYRSRYCAASGLVLVGDAFAFLDPIFSSGVFLALKSGEMAADAIDEALKAGDVGAARFTRYGRDLTRGIEAMRRLVYAFYDQEFSFRRLLNRHADLRGDLTDCLIGHLFREFDDLFGAIGELVELPAPLEHGHPLAGEGFRAPVRRTATATEPVIG